MNRLKGQIKAPDFSENNRKPFFFKLDVAYYCYRGITLTRKLRVEYIPIAISSDVSAVIQITYMLLYLYLLDSYFFSLAHGYFFQK